MSRSPVLSFLLAVVFSLTACSPSPQPLKLIASLPLSGSSESARAVDNAIRLRLEEAGGMACGGRYQLLYEALDDADPVEKKWTEALEKANAEKAAADPTAVVYLGPVNSGAAKISIPLLNQAGLAMISMANTYPGLTKPGLGEPDEPDKYYPTGVRNYLRVITADDVQGAVGASLVKELGATTVYLLDDGDIYGRGVVDVFARAALNAGLTIVGRARLDLQAPNYIKLMNAIAVSNNGQPPDAIYLGLITDSNAAQILRDKVAVLGDNLHVKFIGPDGIYNQAFLDAAGPTLAEGVFVSDPNLSLESVPPLGQAFLQTYNAKYQIQVPSSTPLLGYEAANVTLKAIENICAAGGDPTDRRAVREALFAIKNFQGALGTWSFDANGDTSLTKMTLYRVTNGRFVPYTK